MAKYGLIGTVDEYLRFEWSAREMGRFTVRPDLHQEFCVLLDKPTLRALRDEITAHLGDAPETKPLPVGTVVVGNGLTEWQKLNLPKSEEIKSAAKHMKSGFYWENTPEGHSFWSAIYKRLLEIAKASDAEKERRAQTDVASYTIKTAGSGVQVTRDAYTPNIMTPQEARDLAAALVKHADLTEKGAS